MKFIVCIKQVPDTMEVKIDPKTKRIVREGIPSIINPYDTYALEEGIRLKERFQGESIAITMGPPQADASLRECIAMGIDSVILLSDRAFAGSDTLATSYTLSQAIRKISDVSLVICGREALDGSTGQVGPEIAEFLGFPIITYVKEILNIANGFVECVRLMEDHYETLKSPLPAVITVIKEINEPRLASLKGLLKSKKANIPLWTKNDLGGEDKSYGQDGSPTKVADIWAHEIKKEVKIIQHDEPEQSAEEILNQIKDWGFAIKWK
jgi:electron transfer flavoprotein beta subunit